MAERYRGRVVRMTVAGTEAPEKERFLASVLEEMTGVAAHRYESETRTLTAYVDDISADEASLARALMASGLYPVHSTSVGETTEGDARAC